MKSLLMKVKEKSEKAGLKFNTQKTKNMISSLITSWQRDGETMEAVTDFIFLGSKITADGNCNHEIKRSLLLERKAMTNLVQFTCLVMSNSVTPWTGARQASLSITGSKRLLKLMSIESVMPSNHLILCHPLLLLPSIFASIRVRLEKTLESPLNCKEIKPVNPKGNQY